MVKNPPANAGDKRDAGFIPGLGRFSGRGCDNPPQYSCLENPMDRGDQGATAHGVTTAHGSRERVRELVTESVGSSGRDFFKVLVRASSPQ